MAKETVRKTWWRTLFHHYYMSKDTPKMWNRSDLTDQDIDLLFEEINRNQDDQYKTLSTFFVDPRTVDENKQSTGETPRTPVILLIDSTKISVPKSADFHLQKSSFFKSGHKMTRESITDTTGWVQFINFLISM